MKETVGYVPRLQYTVRKVLIALNVLNMNNTQYTEYIQFKTHRNTHLWRDLKH